MSVSERSAVTIGQLLDYGSRALTQAGRSTPRLDTEVLLGHALGVTRTTLYTWPERAVSSRDAERFYALLHRRREGEPVAYLVGTREFYGLRLEVSRAVLIPRPDTEVLVEAALQCMRDTPGPLQVADVGTGSGAIAIALAWQEPRAHVWATDTSAEALEVARRNVLRHGLKSRVHLLRGALLSLVPERLHVIASNPPYVSEAEFADLPVGVRDYEPKSALVSGPTGLELYEPLAREARHTLRPGGWLLVEAAPWQKDDVLRTFAAAGLVEGQVRPDLAGLPRVVMARQPLKED